jgi:malate dehydrogenase
LNVPVAAVHNVVIWGNHSATQYPDISYSFVRNGSGVTAPVRGAVNNDTWLFGDFISTVQQRGAEVIKARGSSSAASAGI